MLWPFLHRRIHLIAVSLGVLISALGWSVEAVEAAEREYFLVAGHAAFVIMPSAPVRGKGPTPWVWYAPTLGKRHPNRDEKWMVDRLLAAGIAIAGVDVGETYGSPKGVSTYQEFYQEMTRKRRFNPKPVLLARSRGGLMLYCWAVGHPNCVAGIAGIYPVCNIASYPGIEKAAPAFEMTPQDLETSLSKFNPIDNLQGLADARVAVFHIQGDSDKVVPHDENSGLLAKRYEALGGPVEVELVPGQGHNMWRGWFESEKLTAFMIKQCVGE